MNGQVTAETIKMLVQANNTIADLLEMLAVEKTDLENECVPTETIDKVRNRLTVMRYDFTDTIGKLVEEATNTQKEKPIYTIIDGKQWEPMENNGRCKHEWEM